MLISTVLRNRSLTRILLQLLAPLPVHLPYLGQDFLRGGVLRLSVGPVSLRPPGIELGDQEQVAAYVPSGVKQPTSGQVLKTLPVLFLG